MRGGARALSALLPAILTTKIPGWYGPTVSEQGKTLFLKSHNNTKSPLHLRPGWAGPGPRGPRAPRASCSAQAPTCSGAGAASPGAAPAAALASASPGFPPTSRASPPSRPRLAAQLLASSSSAGELRVAASSLVAGLNESLVAPELPPTPRRRLGCCHSFFASLSLRRPCPAQPSCAAASPLAPPCRFTPVSSPLASRRAALPALGL